jgi:hypothetical protein
MKSIDLDYPLSPTATELLLVLVDTAKRYQIQTITCREVRTRRDFEDESDKYLLPQKDPLGSLQKVGLVERLNKHSVRLRAVAFERAKYERRSWLGKWWLRMIRRTYGAMTFI